MRLKKLTMFIALSGLLMPLTSTARAQSERWSFQLAPLWLWAANIQGTSTLGPVTAPLELDFRDDVLENLDAVFTVHFEGQRGDWGFLTEYMHVGLDPSAETRGPTIDVDFTADIGELGVTYRASDKIEVLGGARYTSMEIDVDIVGGPKAGLADESWWDGFIGGRLTVPLSDRWKFVARGDVGAGDSDLVWNVAAHFDYRFNQTFTGFAGYRILDYDFESGSGRNRFGFDGSIEGIIAAVVISWGGAP